MGLIPEKAQLAQDVVGNYPDFFAWVQVGEMPAISVEEIVLNLIFFFLLG